MLAESWLQRFRTGADRLNNLYISESWGGVQCKDEKHDFCSYQHYRSVLPGFYKNTLLGKLSGLTLLINTDTTAVATVCIPPQGYAWFD